MSDDAISGLVAPIQCFADGDFRVEANQQDERRDCERCGKSFAVGRWRRRVCSLCKEQTRSRTSGEGQGRPSRLAECIRDLGHAIPELTRAHEELMSIATVGETGHRQAAMMQDPLSRLDLVSGYCDEILRRFGRSKSKRDGTEDDDRDSSERRRRTAH